MPCLSPEMIVRLSAGTMSPEERHEADEHLTQCEHCRSTLAAARQETSEPRSYAAVEARPEPLQPASPGTMVRVARIFGPIVIGALCSAFFCFTVSLAAVRTLLTKSSAVYDSFPSLDKPLLLQMPLPSEDWLGILYVLGLVAFFGMGLLTALLVRPRDPWDAMSLGLQSALAATLATLPVMIWATTLSLTVVPALPDLQLLDKVVKSGTYAGKQDVTADLVRRYGDLEQQPDFERGNLLFQKIVADSVVGSGDAVLLGILLAIASSGVLALCGTLAGGYLLNRGDRLVKVLFPYLELTIPSSALICALILVPLGTVSELSSSWPSLLPFIPLGLLVPFTLMAVHRRWDVTLRLAVYLTYFFSYRQGLLFRVTFVVCAMLTLVILVRMWLARRPERGEKLDEQAGSPSVGAPRSRRRLYIGLGVAGLLLVALLASYIASQMIAQTKETVFAVVPKNDLAPGTTIGQPEQLLEPREILKRDAPANGVFWGQEESLKGRKLRIAVTKDIPLTEDMLEPRREGLLFTGLDQSEELKKGQRGYAIAVTPDPFLQKAVPGTRVDVSLQPANGPKKPTRVLSDVEILAVDISEDSPPATVVVSVTPQQALLLAKEEERGSLLVGARSGADVTQATPPPPDLLPDVPAVEEQLADPLLPAKIKDDVERRLGSGNQTYTIKIDADRAAGGYAVSGAEVDIIHTWRDVEGQAQAAFLAQKTRVQAVDLAAFRPEPWTRAKRLVPHQITLEVTPKLASLIAQAQKRGTLRLALRSAFDAGEDAGKKP